jgi:hypothetical protein
VGGKPIPFFIIFFFFSSSLSVSACQDCGWGGGSGRKHGSPVCQLTDSLFLVALGRGTRAVDSFGAPDRLDRLDRVCDSPWLSVPYGVCNSAAWGSPLMLAVTR